MIEMNRVTRLLHKVHFLTRHLQAITYSQKYVITADDIIKQEA